MDAETLDKSRASVSTSSTGVATGGPSSSSAAWLGTVEAPQQQRNGRGHSPAFPVTFAHPAGTGSMSSLLGPQSGSSMSGLVHSENGDSNEPSTSPDGQSNRPTPTSSTAGGASSDHQPRQGQGQGQSQSQSQSQQQQMKMEQVGAAAAAAAMYRARGGYATVLGAAASSPSSLMGATPGNDFGVPAPWGDMSGSTGMTPVSEGVLRTIMQMGTMETMDLGWDSNP